VDPQIVLAYIFALVLVYVLFRLLSGPLRLIFRVAYRTALGAGILWVLNLGGNLLGYHFAINLPTAMTVGLLGLPGVVVLALLRRLVA
jgi:inhibitor of the pro-sigma K processing machinery